MNKIVRVLARIGVVRVTDKGVRWPIRVRRWWVWKTYLRSPPWRYDPLMGTWIGVFRNKPGVVKWEEGRLLPRRWGVRIIGLEIGDRG